MGSFSYFSTYNYVHEGFVCKHTYMFTTGNLMLGLNS